MQAYNADVVLDLIVDNLTSRGRGSQTALARAVGVEVQTVNKWAKRQTTPSPDKWAAIEGFFDLPAGHLRAISGLAPTADQLSHVADLRAEVVALRASVAELTALVRRLDRSLDGAAEGAAAPRAPKQAK